MIVQFEGGGPAQGLFKNIPDTNEIRVGTPESLLEGEAAFYIVGNKEAIPGLRQVGAVANFSGFRKSAASLIHFTVDERSSD